MSCIPKPMAISEWPFGHFANASFPIYEVFPDVNLADSNFTDKLSVIDEMLRRLM